MTVDAHVHWQEVAGNLKISQNEFLNFQHVHFSNEAVADFASAFTNLLPNTEETTCPDEYYDWEDADELGFYHDGVKRTLTDEQIAIFRHSELREHEKRQKAKATELRDDAETTGAQKDGSAKEPSQSAPAPGSQGLRKKKKKKGGRNVAHEPKPDLRKRTWDVVDAGLDSLNYD
ncbi:hypothetical protein E4U17_002680 [Claviceps sp. LM77 group G4]|nr:hypothetical protein E4U17_002680 [Claviceps sp. LM77 group G4]KAG6081779.1 hypothetical protein E4U16_006980 [Claviceps sp. LM84 group G4]KAG6084736.1 hypothetical protein E4U33_002876 [Claviceps sp. LM78 group G4]